MKKLSIFSLVMLFIGFLFGGCGILQSDGNITEYNFVLETASDVNSDVTLKFNDDHTFILTDKMNNEEFSGNYSIEKIDTDYKLDLLYSNGDVQEEIIGSFGTVHYHDGSEDLSVTLTTNQGVLYFIAES